MSGSVLRSSPVVCVVLVAGLLTGCIGMRPLDPAAGPVALAEDEGILALPVRTEYPLHAVHAASATLAEELPEGEHLLLLAAPAGTYRWHRLERKFGDWTYWYTFPLDDRARFTVEPGRINYPGDLIVGSPDPIHASGLAYHDERFLTLRIVNRSTMLLERLLARHADLVERFPMRYSGFGRDEFVERYLQARRRLSEAGGAERPAP